jgi:hypothetical protein
MASEWHAAEALNEALEKTNELLLKKFNLTFWLKLAVVVFLVSGGGGFNFNTGFGGGNKSQTPMADFTAMLPLIVAILAVIMVFALILSFIKAVFQFIFIETVSSGSVELVKGFKRNLDAGFNLFLFELGLLIATLFLLAVTLGPIIYLLVKGGLAARTIPLLIAIAAGIVIFMIVTCVMSLIGMLTNDFALAIAFAEKKGVIASWRRLWGLMKANTKQFGVYILVKIALAILATIVLMIVGLLLTIIALIPVVAVGLAYVLMLVVLAMLGLGKGVLILLLAPAVIALIIYFIAVSYCIAVITLPVPVFFRYYSILFLQRLEPGIRIATVRKQEEKPKKQIPAEEKKKPAARRTKETATSRKKLRVY